jgi:methyltransferase-like protein
LAEADPLELRNRDLFPLAIEMFRQSGVSLLAQEQYLDFLKCRRFRQTLLCHDDVALERPVKSSVIKNFHIASCARPLSGTPDISYPTAIEEFQASNGVVMSSNHPLAKAAINHLFTTWPQSERFEDLVSKARQRMGETQGLWEEPDPDIAKLCDVLLAGYGSEVVELHSHQLRAVSVAGERPKVNPLARLQARRGHLLTTLRHTMIEVKDDLARLLITLLDGTKDRDTLVAALITAMRSGQVAGDPGGGAQVANQSFEISLETLEEKLAELASLCLLIA